MLTTTHTSYIKRGLKIIVISLLLSWSTCLVSQERESRMIGYSKENKVTLTLSDNSGSYQTVVRFKTGATDQFDGRYDAFFCIGAPENSVIYSSCNGTDFSINSLANDYNKAVQLVLKTNSPQEFTISYDVELGLEGYSILLLDKLNDDLYILGESDSITFSDSDNWSNDRFEIINYKLVSTGNTPIETATTKACYDNYNHVITDNISLEQITIYSISGKVLLSTTTSTTRFETPQELRHQAAIIIINNRGTSQVIKTIL